MKIKELHIRNIASIEKADINFEQDLNDVYSGHPSPIFLISGDTGTGKSVILDGICLALYKTTPRIKGVANSTSNNFKTVAGETMNINSLEQYTRLGISSKDECYSEVVFEGNKGNVYHARLELGITNRGTKKKPKWYVTDGIQEWQKDADVKSIIEESVGLTFQQFNRMAMLSQGQFADFLCGDKEQREMILERLTNTAIFSKYGAAIKNIFDRSKREKEQAETAFNTESEHIMPQSEVDALNEQKANLEQQKTSLKQQIDVQSEVIEKVSRVVDSANRVEESKGNIDEAVGVRKSEVYLQRKAFVADWDATEQERAQLSLKEQTIGQRDAARIQIAQQKERFGVLSSWLSWQKEKNGEGETWVQQQESWLQERADRAELYAHSGEITVHLDNMMKQSFRFVQAQKGKEGEEAKSKQLKDNFEQAKGRFENVQKRVQEKDDEIKAISQKLIELNVEAVNKDLAEIAERITIHQGCIKLITQQKDQHKKTSEIEKEISKYEVKLESSQVRLEKARQDYNTCKETYDSALGRYSTMKSSVEETLVNLRQRIRDTHADTCPLCGQPIVHEHLDNELFAKLLTPLEVERRETAEKLKDAEEIQKRETEACAILQGSIDAKQSYLKELNDEIVRTEMLIKSTLSSIEIDYDDRAEQNLQTALAQLENREKQLKEQQKCAESLQKDIQQAIEGKKPLETARESAQNERSEAENRVRDNVEIINNFTGQMNEAQQEIRHLQELLSDKIAPFYPDWQTNLENTKKSLKADTQEYNKKKGDFETFSKKLSESKIICEQISEIRQNILNIHADWNLTYLPAKPIQTIAVGDWTSLSQQIQVSYGQMANYDNTITQCQGVIDAWTAKTGRSEEALRLLRDRKSELDVARNFVKKADEDIVAAERIKEEALKAMEKARQELGLQADEAAPDLEGLKRDKKKLEEDFSEVNGSYVGVAERLKSNEANQSKLEDAQKKLDHAKQRFERWYVINNHFGGTRFRTLVQTYILRPLLNNANIYLQQITDRYILTCDEGNEKLSILVLDRYYKDERRSATVLSGGERFMISLALSLALSSLNKADMNVNILFIDEGFGTLDEKSLDCVMATLEKLQDIAGQSNRRVGIISHREELVDRIHTQIRIIKHGEGRSRVEIVNE